MIKKKTIALLCMLCCMRIGIQADTGKSLVIEKNNGAKTTFLLSESPELTFANRSLKVTVNGKNTTFLIDDVSQYYFEAASTPPKTFTCTTSNGSTLTMQVINESSKTAQVGTGERAIDQNADGLLVIPETVNGYTVTGIGAYAFSGCTKLTAIVLPQTITNIGGSAFQNCSGLLYVLLRNHSLINEVSTNIALINGSLMTSPIYVRKDLLSKFKGHTEWKRYNLIGYKLGDANNDGSINVLDIMQVGNKILGKPLPEFNIGGGDANEDNAINVLDIATIGNVILGKTTLNGARMMTPNDEVCQLELQTANDHRLTMNLTGSFNLVAFQFEVTIPEGVTLTNVIPQEGLQVMYHQTSESTYQVVGYSNNATEIANGQILTMETTGNGDVTIDNILFADINEQPIAFSKLTAGTIAAPNTITPLQTSDLRISYSSSQTLVIDGVNIPATVSIHAIDGKAYPANVRMANDRAEISLSQLPTGIYIISINNQQIKVYKK